MKFPWVKTQPKTRSGRSQQSAGQFNAGGYISRRPQPTKPPKNLYRRGSSRTGATNYGLKKLSPESIKDASPREKMKRLQNLKTKMLFGQWFLIVAGLALLFVSYNFTAAVHISLTGDDQVRSLTAKERDDYTATVQRYLNQRPLERFNLMLNEGRLSNHVLDEHAEIKSITPVGVSSLGELAFDLEVRKPVASWRMSGETFFVDSAGVAFKENLYDDPGVSIVDNSGAQSEEGAVLISSSFLRFVGRAIAFSEQRGYQITEVTIPPLAFRQVEFTIHELPYKVLMTTSRNAGVQVEDMDNAIKHFKSQGRNPNYIDVRVEGRAFFRE